MSFGAALRAKSAALHKNDQRLLTLLEDIKSKLEAMADVDHFSHFEKGLKLDQREMNWLRCELPGVRISQTSIMEFIKNDSAPELQLQLHSPGISFQWGHPDEQRF